MKTWQIWFVGMIGCILILVPNLSNQTYAKELDKLIIAGDINYPPYEFVDEQGNYSGFNVDIMRAISIELGMEIVLVPMKWNEAIMALENGEVDVIQGMTHSIEREQLFDFSEPLITNSQQIFIREDSMAILSLEDLSGKTIAFQKGDVNYEWMQQQIEINPIFKKDQSEAMKALIDGEVEAFVGNRLTGLYNLQKNNEVGNIKMIGVAIDDKDYASVVLKGNTLKLEKLNEGIQVLKSNGTYDKVYRKWFGEKFLDNSRYWRKLLAFALGGLFIFMIIAIGIAYLNKKLKNEVEKRTQDILDQQKVIEYSNRYRGQILESIDNGIIAFDSEGVVTSINHVAKSFLHIKHLEDANCHEILDALDISDFSSVLGGDIIKGSYIWNNTMGKSVHLDYRCLPIRNENGITGAILVLYDATLEKQLQSIVNQKDKLESIGRLSAGVAHELRNPLTAIKALVDMMPTKLNDSVFRGRMQEILPHEINRLNTLVGSLLDYAKPKPSNLESVVIEETLRSVLSLHSITFLENKIGLKVDYYKDLTVIADKHQIKQVIINLLRNATDAIESNGTISISTFVEGDFGVIEINDDGNGIPDEHLKNIFEPFFTLKSQGYGIGLSICHQLIIENKGDISFESEEGKGTIVRVQLPMEKEGLHEKHTDS